MKLNVFGSIRHTLQASQLLHKLEDRSAKGLSVGIDPAGYKGSDLRSNKILDNQFLSTEEHAIQGLCREEQPTHSIVRLQDEDSRDSPQGSTETRCTADVTHARMLQLQQVGLAATVTNTLDNEGEA